MSKRNPKLYIDDLLSSIKRIEQYTTDISFDQFDDDQKTIDAVVRNLQVIGEAARAMPDSVKHKNPDIPWDKMIGMRNVVIHEYFGVDTVELWSTIQNDLPALKKQLKKLVI